MPPEIRPPPAPVTPGRGKRHARDPPNCRPRQRHGNSPPGAARSSKPIRTPVAQPRRGPDPVPTATRPPTPIAHTTTGRRRTVSRSQSAHANGRAPSSRAPQPRSVRRSTPRRPSKRRLGPSFTASPLPHPDRRPAAPTTPTTASGRDDKRVWTRLLDRCAPADRVASDRVASTARRCKTGSYRAIFTARRLSPEILHGRGPRRSHGFGIWLVWLPSLRG